MGNPDERRSARANVILKAVIEWHGGRANVRVGNLSAHGALVIGEGLPVRDTNVTFRCHETAVSGWIMWATAERAGIQFEQPVDPEAVAHRPAPPKAQISPDTRELDFRRPGFRGNQMTDEERKMVEEWTRPPPEPDEDES
jgi:hypothetical protein